MSEHGLKQTVDPHLTVTAALSAAFGAETQGSLLGLAHDIGKFSDAFQRRLLAQGSKVDHSTAGAMECARRGMEWAAFCVAGHHGGLPDGGSPLDDSDSPTFLGRLKKAKEGQIPAYSSWPGALPTVPPPSAMGRDGLADAFFIRMLYSCLVDGNFLDTEAFMSPAPS